MSQRQDPGFGERFLERSKRVINKDGSFNVRRVGIDSVFRNTFQFLRNSPWWQFNLMIIISYFVINAIFALIYLSLGIENIHNARTGTFLTDFASAFYFSVQTFTTVGYGVLAPKGGVTSFVAAIEAFMGFMGFALATGLLYGRFSRPSAKLLFSNEAIIAPHKGRNALMFRMINRRSNILMELEARVMIKLEELDEQGEWRRTFSRLKLETDYIHFFPMNWTIVHVIDRESPLFNMSEEDMKAKKLEVLILIKAYDETFAQHIHARFSYTHQELKVGAKFERVFETEEDGEVRADIRKIHNYVEVPLDKDLKEEEL